MDWRTFLIIVHILGTTLGAGGSTLAEIFVTQALKDGKIDETENRYLHLTYTVIRVGMLFIILSGFGLLLLARLNGQEEHLYSPRLWAKLTITGIILINALLLQTRKIPFWLGSAVALTSWYAAFIIGAWRTHASFATILGVYGIAILVVALVLTQIRKMQGVKL